MRLRVFQPGADACAPAPDRLQPAVVDVLVDVLVLVLVDDVELVVVVVVVDVELVVVVVEVVVVVHGCVTVTVVGCVTVTVTVFFFGFGQAPSLSPRRMCAFTALFATLIVTSFFDPFRWHIVTFGFFGFFLAAPCGPAIATDAPSPSTKTATSSAFSFMPAPLVLDGPRVPGAAVLKRALGEPRVELELDVPLQRRRDGAVLLRL